MKLFPRVVKIPSSMIRIIFHYENIKLEAMICPYFRTYDSRRLQFVFVNKRYIVKSEIRRYLNLLLSIGFREAETKHQLRLISSNKCNTVFILNISCPKDEYEITFQPIKRRVDFKNRLKVEYCLVELTKKFFKQMGVNGVSLNNKKELQKCTGNKSKKSFIPRILFEKLNNANTIFGLPVNRDKDKETLYIVEEQLKQNYKVEGGPITKMESVTNVIDNEAEKSVVPKYSNEKFTPDTPLPTRLSEKPVLSVSEHFSNYKVSLWKLNRLCSVLNTQNIFEKLRTRRNLKEASDKRKRICIHSLTTMNQSLYQIKKKYYLNQIKQETRVSDKVKNYRPSFNSSTNVQNYTKAVSERKLHSISIDENCSQSDCLFDMVQFSSQTVTDCTKHENKFQQAVSMNNKEKMRKGNLIKEPKLQVDDIFTTKFFCNWRESFKTPESDVCSPLPKRNRTYVLSTSTTSRNEPRTVQVQENFTEINYGGRSDNCYKFKNHTLDLKNSSSASEVCECLITNTQNPNITTSQGINILKNEIPFKSSEGNSNLMSSWACNQKNEKKTDYSCIYENINSNMMRLNIGYETFPKAEDHRKYISDLKIPNVQNSLVSDELFCNNIFQNFYHCDSEQFHLKVSENIKNTEHNDSLFEEKFLYKKYDKSFDLINVDGKNVCNNLHYDGKRFSAAKQFSNFTDNLMISFSPGKESLPCAFQEQNEDTEYTKTPNSVIVMGNDHLTDFKFISPVGLYDDKVNDDVEDSIFIDITDENKCCEFEGVNHEKFKKNHDQALKILKETYRMKFAFLLPTEVNDIPKAMLDISKVKSNTLKLSEDEKKYLRKIVKPYAMKSHITLGKNQNEKYFFK